ncbi:hypothetical protein PORUE0001_0275 [Porphyromonas uenonis 60-3]|uniref:Uncharacterized protein n=1 Tax=Porphyromonas uenonis 60-3 TaxID=596327 RepID=C2M9U7_9PORP|nr:hypothetical protein PORUE0001_0275 [Porphyromonas uenonis 60-3]
MRPYRARARLDTTDAQIVRPYRARARFDTTDALPLNTFVRPYFNFAE